jgi:hypothetical protein
MKLVEETIGGTEDVTILLLGFSTERKKKNIISIYSIKF